MNNYEALEYGSTHLLPRYCMRSSIEFDMQHDHIPKKLNFGLSSTPSVHLWDKFRRTCFIPIVPLLARWIR